MADYISTHTGAQIDAAVDAVSTKQDLLTAGTGIDITDNTVSTTIVVPTKVSDLENDSSFVSDSSLSEALSEKQDVLTAGTGIDITDNTVSTTIVVPTKVSDLENDSSFITDSSLSEALSEKQDVLTAGDNITITGNEISATDTTYTAGEGIDITDNVISATGGGGGGNDWYGTQMEFDALEEYDTSTNYYISEIKYSEIKGAPNMANYYRKAEVDAKDSVLEGKIASKTELTYMTQEEFDDITPLEGKVYAIEGVTKTFTVTYSDETTETFNVVVD